MFRRINQSGKDAVTFSFDGESVSAVAGESVASALLAAGVSSFRKTPVSGAERAPFCMMGACYDCQVEIDGRNVQACMTPVSQGLVVQRPADLVEEVDG